MTYPEPLHLSDFNSDPIKQFGDWFNEISATDFFQPNTMSLATADRQGQPSARMVLLQSFDPSGFVFFTNYESQKGIELAENSRAALIFYWDSARRQVRVEGEVSKISPKESDSYFATRPRGSQLAAWTSSQSQVESSRDNLDLKYKEIEKFYEDRDVDRPPHWGGYRLTPQEIEFWQHADSRMHDRIRYVLQDSGGWLMDRLAP
jgi:pyridoxamine 5'-phosphate oxidase